MLGVLVRSMVFLEIPGYRQLKSYDRLFIGCAGFLLWLGFSWGLFSSYGARACHCGGLSCCRAWAVEGQAFSSWQLVGSVVATLGSGAQAS